MTLYPTSKNIGKISPEGLLKEKIQRLREDARRALAAGAAGTAYEFTRMADELAQRPLPLKTKKPPPQQLPLPFEED